MPFQNERPRGAGVPGAGEASRPTKTNMSVRATTGHLLFVIPVSPRAAAAGRTPESISYTFPLTTPASAAEVSCSGCAKLLVSKTSTATPDRLGSGKRPAGGATGVSRPGSQMEGEYGCTHR